MPLRNAACIVWIFNVLIIAVASTFVGWLTATMSVAIGWGILLAMCIPSGIAEAFTGTKEVRVRSRIGDFFLGIAFLGLLWLSVVAFPIAFSGMYLYERAKDAAANLQNRMNTKNDISHLPYNSSQRD